MRDQTNVEMSRMTASTYMYDELQRLFITAPLSQWLYINNNWNYELCPSYSRHIVIPKTFPLSKIETAASYRSKKRLPALTWVHPENNAPLCRCAQPRSGFTQMASMPEDDEMLLAIRSTVMTTELPNPILHIFDARPKLNANANALAGKGFENVSRLGGPNVAKIIFCGIGNIHVMRNSLAELTKTCETYNQLVNEDIGATAMKQRRRRRGSSSSSSSSSKSSRPTLSSSAAPNSSASCSSFSATSLSANTSSSFHEKIGRSKWLDHSALLIRSASNIADILQRGQPCVVHCSDGWDRTSQLSALSQLMLDPYYSTINGFKALVEKDFQGFGHKFQDRIGVYATNGVSQNERSPIFLQFLDVVYQMYYQQTKHFEFDEQLLLFLCDCCYNGYYGTFLCNNEQERSNGGCSTDTLSCWEYIDQHRSDFLNPLYEEYSLMQEETTGETEDEETKTEETVTEETKTEEETDVVANSLTQRVRDDGGFHHQQEQQHHGTKRQRHSTRRLYINGDTSSMVLFASLYMKESIHIESPFTLMKKKVLQLLKEQNRDHHRPSLPSRSSRPSRSDTNASVSSNDSNSSIHGSSNVDGDTLACRTKAENHLMLVEERRRHHGNANAGKAEDAVHLGGGNTDTNKTYNNNTEQSSGSHRLVSVLDTATSSTMNSDALMDGNDIQNVYVSPASASQLVVLASGGSFACNVKKVSIISGGRSGRYAAYLVRVSQSNNSSSFFRRFSDFVSLDKHIKKFRFQGKWHHLPSKDLFRWYGHAYLEERRSHLNAYVQQLSIIASKNKQLEDVVHRFLDPSLPAGLEQ